jgi:hypothetical protein
MLGGHCPVDEWRSRIPKDLRGLVWELGCVQLWFSIAITNTIFTVPALAGQLPQLIAYRRPRPLTPDRT